MWRLQVRLVVGDVGDAGTDDEVIVRLNTPSTTWLDHPVNDFQRNSSRLYDLPLTGVEDVGDISSLRVLKGGDDGLCLRRVDLLVNGRIIFDRVLGGSNPCIWLDGNVLSTTISSATLRADDDWIAWRTSLPSPVITPAEWRARIETIVGDRIHDNALYWGDISGEAVELQGLQGPPRLRIDLDQKADVNNLPDVGVDIDFDLLFVCDGDTLRITSTDPDVDADSDLFWEVISLGTINLLDNKVRDDVVDGFSAITQQIDVDGCPQITIQPDGTTVILP